jgi:proteasome lid subunit RPN8/RPN11
MVVRIAKGQLSYFKQKARARKTEVFALMFGQRLSQHLVQVLHFAYPVMKVQEEFSCEADDDSYYDHVELAEEAGLTFLGSIHSHPPRGEPFMSHADAVSARLEREIISGIYHVNGAKSILSFWTTDSPVPCEWDYIQR